MYVNYRNLRYKVDNQLNRSLHKRYFLIFSVTFLNFSLHIKIKKHMPEQKPLSHDRLQSECFMYVWNKYPQTRHCMFHPANEMRMISKDVVKLIVITALRSLKLFAPLPQIDTFIAKLDLTPFRIRALSLGKAIGVVPGIMDLIFFWGNKMYAFDIKVGTDKLSTSQKEFITAITAQGGQAYEIRSVEQFKLIIEGIMSGNNKTP